MTISANASPGVGGQGLNFKHMLDAFAPEFGLRIFSGAPQGTPGHVPIPPSRLSSFIGRIPGLRRLRSWRSYLSDRGFDRAVARRLERMDLFQGATGQCRDSLIRARRLGCPTMLDVVTLHVDDFYREQKKECSRFRISGVIHPQQRRRTLEEYQLADTIRVMSHVARETFLKRGFSPEKVIVAHPPMDLESFPRAMFSEPVFRVAFVGLLEPWKGFHYLVDAFNGMTEKNRELVLWGGTGSRPVHQYFQEKTRQHPGIKLRPETIRGAGLNEVYGKASVLVHPSLADGFGLVVAEAMACGVPVIVTSCAGAADLVRDGENGYVVPPRDPNAIRERLDYLAANSALLPRLGEAALKSTKTLTLGNFRKILVDRARSLIRI